ncbi:MAG: histidine phosphatase family protein [Planctomycetota bacterium]
MILAIVRHGKAESGSTSGRDADRPLTPRGTRQAAYLAEELATRVAGCRIATSDAVRARDTAAIIADALGASLTFDDRLRVDEPLPPVLDLIRTHARDTDAPLVVVGHNPQFSRLCGVLTLGHASQGLELKTGAAAVIELNIDPDDLSDPRGTLAATLRLTD